MSATLINLSGFTFGFATSETGINIEQFQVKSTSKKIEVPDIQGATRGLVIYDPTNAITFEGEVTALPTNNIGDAITLANIIALGGVSSGAIILHDITYTKSREKLDKASFSATRYPGVTATPTSGTTF